MDVVMARGTARGAAGAEGAAGRRLRLRLRPAARWRSAGGARGGAA